MLTVLFATLNGEHTLPGVLTAYEQLIPPPGGWKLVVVDNGSADKTPEILNSFRARLPLTDLREPSPGKNRALNIGLECLQGDLAVLTDDDIFPDPRWLVELREAADQHSSFQILSGLILPRWEIPPPEWILQNVPQGVTYALSDTSQKEGPTTPDRIFGPNMAIRSEIFKTGYRFDASVGPSGTNYAMGSETRLVRKLFDDGYKAWYCPRAIVQHAIRARQLDRKWILGRAVRYGRGQYRLNAHKVGATPLWFGIPRYLYRRIFEQFTQVARAMATRDFARTFEARWELNESVGQCIEARILNKEKLGSSKGF